MGLGERKNLRRILRRRYSRHYRGCNDGIWIKRPVRLWNNNVRANIEDYGFLYKLSKNIRYRSEPDK